VARRLEAMKLAFFTGVKDSLQVTLLTQVKCSKRIWARWLAMTMRMKR
jgi:hypothetical protein